MVRLAGIEPTTPWFVAKYSIQLSYSRTAFKYSTGRCGASVECSGGTVALLGACIVSFFAGLGCQHPPGPAPGCRGQ